MAENKFTLHVSFVTGTKSFSPNPTQLGVPTTLTINLTNPDLLNDAPGNFTDLFPPGMEVANPALPTVSGNLLVPPPIFSPLPSATSISGFAQIPANSSVVFTVKVVVPIGNLIGGYLNTITDVFNQPPTTQATLTITAAPTKKKRNGLKAPICFNPSTFPTGKCPLVFDYRANGTTTRLYRIGDTCCYTPYPQNNR